MRNINKYGLALLAVCMLTLSACQPVAKIENASVDLSDKFKVSMAYVEVTTYPWETFQSWKQGDPGTSGGYGIAVAKDEIIYPANKVIDATDIKVKPFGQDDFVKASVKITDYESNLALLKLETEKMAQPMVPVEFYDIYKKGAEVEFFKLKSNGVVDSGRAFIDDHQVSGISISYTRHLYFKLANVSQALSSGEIITLDGKPIGMGSWSSGSNSGGIVVAKVINHFLEDNKDGVYKGFPTPAFSTTRLIDPTMRRYLGVPAEIKNGCYVTNVNPIGTGADVLKKGDVILAIDGKELDAYGRYMDPIFKEMSYYPLITDKQIGDNIKFEIYRDGKKMELDVTAANFKVEEMLIDYYTYGKQPEYIITNGFVFHKLTRPYVTAQGAGRALPRIEGYLNDESYKATKDRQDIVVLTFTIPLPTNRGYQNYSQLVVKNVNGTKISNIAQMDQLLAENKEEFHVIQFEGNYPDLVIPVAQAKEIDTMYLPKMYGIKQMKNIEKSKVN
ncbi:MAG: PDZ domain-containing protein [Phycisphaerae bacterium]|nr:PDZ domain-containing protein [Phycisphaerae bacterium]